MFRVHTLRLHFINIFLLFLIWLFIYLPTSVPPHIVPFVAEEPVFAGESVQLNCHVSKGDLPLTITWSFHGKELSSHQGITTMKIGERTSLLTISSATAGNSGEYWCHAANHAGVAVHSTTINVHGTLTISSARYNRLYRTLHACIHNVIISAFWINSITSHRTVWGGRVSVRWWIGATQLSCVEGWLASWH